MEPDLQYINKQRNLNTHNEHKKELAQKNKEIKKIRNKNKMKRKKIILQKNYFQNILKTEI